jgi:receptor protein-tyrosine kinase
MSRVHEALRRAEQLLEGGAESGSALGDDPVSLVVTDEAGVAEQQAPVEISNGGYRNGVARSDTQQPDVDWRNFLSRCRTIPFHPAPETHLIDNERPHELPAEEFRSLRTRLNHLQSQQDLHSIVVTSASPAEGKSFTAVNLALAQSQLETPVLLADLDLRRPVIHSLLQCERTPGFSDFLSGEKPLEECIRKIEGSNLYFLPAGSQVKNPLELLNMRHVKYTLEGLRKVFNWIILDTPPLLFSADANLLSTLTDGTLIVVRIGSTTYDSVIRAMQTLCENNVLGIVANGARAGELYSKYTYYYSKPEEEPAGAADDADNEEDEEEE